MSNANAVKSAISKFFSEDIVRRVEAPGQYGVVMRCWHDSEDVPPHSPDPLLRPLKKGEVGVQFFPSGHRDILPETEFQLVDRPLQLGDACKRGFDEVQSGIVVHTEVQARVEHAITGVKSTKWVSREDIMPSLPVCVGDFVICDDWVGQIEEIFDEVIVELSPSRSLYRFAEVGGRFSVGDRGSDLVPMQPGYFGLGSWFGPRSRGANDIIVDLRPTVLAVSWLAINQTLPREDLQNRQRPPRFWAREDLDRLASVGSRGETLLRVGERVLFKDTVLATAAGITPSQHGSPTDGNGQLEVSIVIVNETRSVVEVLWQDGTKEKLLATDLIPYLNVDEYDCWPGDYVLWKGEGEQKVAIVQSANAKQRTASVRWHGTNETELVSVLELDPHGSSADGYLTPGGPENFGVRRGDFVLIHPEGSTNGSQLPRVPRLGELEDWVREVPTGNDIKTAGWRGEMAEIGMKVAAERDQGSLVEGKVSKRQVISWFGEVTNLRTDGLTEITLPHGEVASLPLDRLTVVHDGMEGHMDEMWGDESEEEFFDGDLDMQMEYDDVGGDEVMSDGSWETADGEDQRDAWGHMEVESQAHSLTSVTEVSEGISLTPNRMPGTFTPLTPSSSSGDATSPQLPAVSSTSSPQTATKSTEEPSDADEIELSERFVILPQAPADHAFYSRAPIQPNRAFLSRLSKEYRVLMTSLPESIFVRAYEDRTDLLRCMIIGPENTPYEDAPFVIDWLLESTFPNTPPVAHFLSWTNGNGRVNPNLYEEGKVCLSILGTWAGDKSESWSASRSSMLQAFVSIQGLVLVKEPWYCEPAFDKLRGTVEGTVNSRLYSEKAYVLSRGFVRRALEIPLGGLEREVHRIYFTEGRLDKVLRDARNLIAKSGDETTTHDTDVDHAVPRLSAGGILSLNRSLAKLQALRDQHHASAA